MGNGAAAEGTLAFTRRQVVMAMSSIFVAYLVYGYFINSLNVATPKIAAKLGGMDLYSWSVSIPSLGLAIGTVLAGKLSDLYGRRALLWAALTITLLGAALSGMSPTFQTHIAGRTLLFLGIGSIMPLVYAVIGDMFTGGDRNRLVGLLNIPFGIPALLGPTMSGWFVENVSWRLVFWWIVPLIILCLLCIYGMPSLISHSAQSVQGGRSGAKIDVLGATLVTIAASALIFGLSIAGTKYPWLSVEVLGLLATAVVFGILFLRAEAKAAAPILDLELLKSRHFVTAAIAGSLSLFGLIAIALYLPLLMQGIQGANATESGRLITPFGFLMAFVGIPTGFILARRKGFKWIYIVSYSMLTLVAFGMMLLSRGTPLIWSGLAAALGGIGLGAIPTLNAVVIQSALPRRLLGVAMSAFFFSVSMGQAVAPALLGSAMTVRYLTTLQAELPESIARNDRTMAELKDPSALVSGEAMDQLRKTLSASGNDAQMVDRTVKVIGDALESGLRVVFVIAGLTMLASLILICTIPSRIPAADEMKEAHPESVAV